MKSINSILILLFIGVCHRCFAADKPPEDCSKCVYSNTSTIPEILGCKAEKKLSDDDVSLLYKIEKELQSNCQIADPCRRVQSITSPTGEEFENDTYDFIIVGAGIGGLILANKLIENEKNRVLLLEAGPEEPVGPSVPYFFSAGLKSDVDWKYKTIPQKNACLNSGGVCDWPRGKMICGTFCLSGMMYTRGSPKIYNQWEADGNAGWKYNITLEYFKKSERNFQNKTLIDEEYHGRSGMMPIDNFPHMPKIGELMLKAAEETGFKIQDLNGKNQTGFAPAPVMTEKGIRASPSRIYLRPAVDRPNLRVFIESYATKILFNADNKTASAVEFTDKFNVSHTIKAAKEIILSGGTVGSAQLLMLSGIGPKEDLEKLQIPVIRDLPVGKNLHYHVGVEGTARFEHLIQNEFTEQSLKTYLENQTGPFSSTGLTQVSGFWSSSAAEEGIPDIQFFLDPFCSGQECYKFNNEYKNVTLAGMRSIYLVSKCRGTIKLASKNPSTHPVIDPNYLCNQEEIKAVVEGIRKLQQILKASPLKDYYKSFGAANESLCKSHPKDSDDYWICQTRYNTLGENHHAGTCKMGPEGDPTAVVSPEFVVHGTKNIRVVDASIMPTPINCNTIAPVIMFAERAADAIIGDDKQ